MSVVSDLLRELGVRRDCLANAWAGFQTDLEAAYMSADAPYIAWLLVRIGYSYDEVTGVVRSLFAVPDELKQGPINAYNTVCRFLWLTGVPDDAVAQAFRDKYPYDEVVTKLLSIM